MTITSADFNKAPYIIAATQYSQLDIFIAEKDKYIRKILGWKLYEAYLATPANERFTFILSPFYFENIESGGLKNCVIGLIYANYQLSLVVKASTSGNQTINTEGAQSNNLGAIVLYNRAVDNIKNLQSYLMNKRNAYPEFLHNEFKYMSPL